MGVDLPDARACLEIYCVELPLGTESENSTIGHHRHRTGAFVETEIVSIGSRIVVSPKGLASVDRKGLDDLPAPLAVE